MFKALLVIGLIGFVLYFVSKKISGFVGTTATVVRRNQYLLLRAGMGRISKISNMAIANAGAGFILLVIVLVLAIKIKILLILLPISLYLIGQLFVLTNHIRATKNQAVWFDPDTSDFVIEYVKDKTYRFNLLRDVTAVEQVESIQKTKGLSFGYYRLITKDNVVEIPYMLFDANSNPSKLLMDTIDANFRIEVNKKLFPII